MLLRKSTSPIEVGHLVSTFAVTNRKTVGVRNGFRFLLRELCSRDVNAGQRQPDYRCPGRRTLAETLRLHIIRRVSRQSLNSSVHPNCLSSSGQQA
eukprot:4171982-Pyramimonas_sp.AAC.2